MVTWLRVLVSPVADLHATMVELRSRTLYAMQITGQTIYLEKALNDRFDPLNRDIYIENLADLTQLYIYNKVELRPAPYLYNKWSQDQAYLVGQFAVYGQSVWRCSAVHSNQVPVLGSPFWTFHSERFILINKLESLQAVDFIVWVPVLLPFDVPEMRALINRYKAAGKRYKIMTY
ncbi:MAG TPA: hypothetical protein PKE21_13890 [Flavobacteriales bacterium]|nr:hypothetical protein [Flavobacteriales bacterium]HMR28569.1 hypothetical protein [Flavobacteriales bacterium]